jgi:hypothetical protein
MPGAPGKVGRSDGPALMSLVTGPTVPVPFRISILTDACPGTVGHLTSMTRSSDGGSFLRVNGVDVIPFVEAEFNHRFPGRATRRADHTS